MIDVDVFLGFLLGVGVGIVFHFSWLDVWFCRAFPFGVVSFGFRFSAGLLLISLECRDLIWSPLYADNFGCTLTGAVGKLLGWDNLTLSVCSAGSF